MVYTFLMRFAEIIEIFVVLNRILSIHRRSSRLFMPTYGVSRIANNGVSLHDFVRCPDSAYVIYAKACVNVLYIAGMVCVTIIPVGALSDQQANAICLNRANYLTIHYYLNSLETSKHSSNY